jgi:hypothetical protein
VLVKPSRIEVQVIVNPSGGWPSCVRKLSEPSSGEVIGTYQLICESFRRGYDSNELLAVRVLSRILEKLA